MMKRYVLLLLPVVLLFSCKDKKSTIVSDTLSGGSSEVLVVMDREKWESPVGDTLKKWFQQVQVGLPQPEPMFDVLNVPEPFFDGIRKKHRSVLFVRISDRVKQPSIVLKESPWAKTQQYFRIEAPSDSAFQSLFETNKRTITNTFLQAEQLRLGRLYKQQRDPKIDTFFRENYKLNLSVPLQYVINKHVGDFVWISRETKVESRGLICFQRPYTDKKQFETEAILEAVNGELQLHVPGPSQGSYMGLDVRTTLAEYYQYNDKHYAVLLRGLWSTVNDYMGGPFVLNVVLDQRENRVIYMMGYVYAPDDTKRDVTRKVEGILNTMSLD